ncbi:pseudouridine synthase [Enterocloster aldenensis]|nr:pseudouridine synthase [uncultured Lachnoclostridium sp.]MCG4749119.1 pseudouridine synthase [Enterocloster aldenensis]MDM8296292.1 pseudouridine synthase [Enterocloster aldenensis]
MGVCSRREADRLIEAGKVWVDGCPAAMGQKLKPGQKVVCGGVPVNAGSGAGSQKPRPVLLVVNKPRGIVCTTSDKDRAMNIVEYLDYPERIYPVGRLDKDSEGLLLMTNQGDLVNKIMRSGNAHEKEYIVTVDCPLTDDAMDRMAKGIYLKELDTVTRPCKVKRVDGKTCSIILTQGLNRQIRRMCEACGCHVKRLVRVRIMNIRLDGLKTGAFREVGQEEYRELTRLLKDSTSLPGGRGRALPQDPDSRR